MMTPTRRTGIIAASAAALVVLGVGAFVLAQPGPPAATATPSASASPSPTASVTPTPSAAPYAAPDDATVAALPEARYNAVIPALLGFASNDVPAELTAAYTIAADAPLFGDDRITPVARLAAKNFLGDSTVVVPVRTDGDWSLVLTPARQTLPSENPDAPAQSVGWIRSELLTKAQDLAAHVVISVGDQTVSIVDASGDVRESFPAAVGASETPTPTGVVGYVQARYLDPAQDQTVYPITLSSMHSSAADEPFGGQDGGLIGIHFYEERSGAISHGCVRVSGDAITALDTLPLGTPILIQP